MFLAVPRTGSRVTYRVLEKHYGCVGGFEGRMSHGATTPEDCRGYLHVACARNPFERAVSYWAFAKKWAPRDDEPYRSIIQHVCDAPDDFIGFARLFLPVMIPAARMIYGSRAASLHLLRFERLQETFDALPFVEADAHDLSIRHNPETARWRDWYTPEAEALVLKYQAPDFELFGYPRRVEPEHDTD